MLSQMEIDVFAADLFRQHQDRAPFQGAPDLIPTIADAHDIQDAFVRLLLDEEGTTVGGYKVALTSKRMCEWLKINEPCAGQVLASHIHVSPHTIKVADFVRLSIEPEVCVILDRDMAGPCTVAEVRRNLRSVHSAYELVEDRAADLTRLDARSLVADNSWNGGIVLGAPGPLDLDLVERRGVLSVDGQYACEGTTAETMDGDPLDAVAWLAGHLGKRGSAIRAGQPVMTGSIMKSQFIGAGHVLEFAIDGLPPVELRLI